MLNEHWYVACAASQLGREPRAVRLLDEPLVAFRGADGAPAVLEDRCCHRGVQLSLGSVTAEGHIACRYHGWEYDAQGRCRHVPSLCAGARVPDGFRVHSRPCIEQDHYVWAWMGDEAPTDGPSRLRGLQDGGWTQGVIESACSADLLMDNILDSSHTPFAHAGTHWGYFLNRLFGFKSYEYEVRQTEHGLAVFYPPAATDGGSHLDEGVGSYLEFELPDRLYVCQRGVKSQFYLVLHAVRCGPAATRVEWLMKSREPAQGVLWKGNDNLTLHQDRVLLESVQACHDREGTDFERHVPADFATLQARRVLALAREGGWLARRHELTQRKLVSVRQ